MMKKLAIGVAGLAVIGGGAWAATQYFGPVSSQEQTTKGQSAEDDEDKQHLVARRRGPVQVDANGSPLLRNGLWKVSTVTDGVTMTAKICLDEAFQKEASMFSLQLMGAACPGAPEISRSGDTFVILRTCAMGPVRQVGTTRVSGDMHTTYLRQTELVTTGPGVPPDTSNQREQGTFEGACPAGMAGGDMDMNGGRINARMLMAIGGAAALPSGALNELDFERMTPPRPAE